MTTCSPAANPTIGPKPNATAKPDSSDPPPHSAARHRPPIERPTRHPDPYDDTNRRHKMCVMCNGASRQDVRDHFRQQIDMKGFALCVVTDGADDAGWAYTIGLTRRWEHPELVVAGQRLTFATAVLDGVAARVVRGERFHCRATTDVMKGTIGFVEVRSRHIRHGLMDGWLGYYESEGEHDVGLTALQLLLPDGHHCFEHQVTQPRLDAEESVLLTRPNRAARRAARARARARPVRR
jgi:hypothetical protein